MADKKRILVVDDHFEMLEFLRSMLELSDQDYDVLSVPSAEEAMLELRGTDFDLLITDVRLPGMSGFDLVRKVQSFKLDIPTIMITAYSSAQGQQEATDLGVYRYFQKPLDTDEMLMAVHTAVYGELVVRADASVQPEEVDLTLPDEVSQRLETLRADTGATRLLLVTLNGQILLTLGSGRKLDLPKLSATMAQNLSSSFLLTEELGGNKPTTIQYHAGNRVELYIANVGPDYFLAIFFDIQARRGRIGTIWVFAQRAIKELSTLLPSLDLLKQDAPPSPKPRPTLKQSALPVRRQPPLPPAEPAPPPPPAKQPSASHPRAEREKIDKQFELLAPSESDGFFSLDDASDKSSDLDTFWDTAVKEGSGIDRGGLSLAEARQQGLIPVEEGPLPEMPLPDVSQLPTDTELPAELESLLAVDAPAAEMDGFWDAALAESSIPDSAVPGGLSLAEAQRQGLIPGGIIQKDGKETAVPDATTSTEAELPGFPPLDETDSSDSLNLDDFWDTAMATGDTGVDDQTGGFSLEEAKRRGLIPSELELDENAD